MSNSTPDEIVAAFQDATTAVVIGHYSPDPDAYGACAAVALVLRSFGVQTEIFNETGIVDRFSFMPLVSEVTTNSQSIHSADLLVVCDCGDVKRVGDSVVDQVRAHSNVVNIDHHDSNNYFGRLNLVEKDASSTSEILYDLFAEGGVEIKEETAQALYIGLLFDTGSFRYALSPNTFKVASALVSAGAMPEQAAKDLFGRETLAGMRLKADALLHMKLHFGDRLAEIHLSEELLTRHNATPEDGKSLVNTMLEIEGVEISMFSRFEGGLLRVSLRSASRDFDVSAVAASFGGGGHTRAAAFRSRQPYEKVRKELLRLLKETLA